MNNYECDVMKSIVERWCRSLGARGIARKKNGQRRGAQGPEGGRRGCKRCKGNGMKFQIKMVTYGSCVVAQRMRITKAT